MKPQPTTLEQLTKLYAHPSIALFRAIELKAIYALGKDKEFFQPSLDLGCGDGRIAEILFDEKFTYGLDNGEARDVEQAINHNRYGNVLLEDARRISLEDGAVSFVFSNCVLEHIPEIEEVISQVARILKPGGAFLFTVPNEKYSQNLYLSSKLTAMKLPLIANFYIRFRNAMLRHFNLYSLEQWKDILSKQNMEVVAHQAYFSAEALMLWDWMALEIFIKNKITGKAQEKVRTKCAEKIRQLYEERGANDEYTALAIYARKKINQEIF